MKVTSADPIVLAELPTGTYTVTAETKGRTLSRRFRVSTKGRVEELFLWSRSAVS